MRPSIIFSSVGQPLPTEGRYADNHWRRTDRESRLYETAIVNYNYESGFKPEPYSYDDMLEEKGYKWPLAHKFIKARAEELMERYEYIGIWDDDVETSIEALNHSLTLAHNEDAKIWQMSLSKESDTRWDILRNNPSLTYSLTNFAEIMCPVYHTSLIPLMLNFWDLYELNMGWGFDTVACELAETPAMIIHSQEMYHPTRAESTYDKGPAFEEMDICINKAYPAYWKKYHDIDITFKDRQVVYSRQRRID